MLIPLWKAEWCIPFWVTFTLTMTSVSGLISRFFVSGAYPILQLANFPRMCLMLDQFLWGHSSRDCDISCSEYYGRFAYQIKGNEAYKSMLVKGLPLHTPLTSGVDQNVIFFFSESSQVACQINRNEA